MPPPTPERLAQHIRDLAAAFHIELHEDPTRRPDQASAQHLLAGTALNLAHEVVKLPGAPESRHVQCHPIIDESTYAVALHELGHHLAPNGMMPSKEKLLSETLARFARLIHLEETEAWEWAHHHALYWTPLMDSVQTFAMGTYDRRVEEALELDALAKLLDIRYKNVREARDHAHKGSK